MRASRIRGIVRALTSRCGITSNPESAEDALVDGSLETVRVAKELGTRRLLLARLNWDKLFESASPPGAIAPSAARGSLTRQAIRAKEQRRRALRSGYSGLLAAIRVGV